MKPQQVMDDYRAQLRRLYGDVVADETALYYVRGWYYLNMAKAFRDGSVGVIGLPTPYRKKQLVMMTENLRRRKTNDG